MTQSEDNFSRVLRDHPALTIDENRALAVTFLEETGRVCDILAALFYPVERMMLELKSGRKQYNRERLLGPGDETKRSSGVAPSHADEFDGQAQRWRERRIVQENFEQWLAGFLRRFTFNVIEDISKFATEFTPDSGGGVRGKQLRAKLSGAIADGTETRNKMIQGNMRLVLREVNSERTRKMMREQHVFVSEEDLFMVGIQGGLTVAINAYDPERGALSTYAVGWIKQAIDRHILENRYIYRIPIALQKSLEHERRGEAIERKGINKFVATPSAVSIHAQVGSQEDESTYEQVLPDEGAELPHATVATSELQGIVNTGIGQMDLPTKLVMGLRYGLGDPSETAREIYLQEAATSDRRATRTVSDAQGSSRQAAKIKVKEGGAIPEKYR